jgi:hypothetical protein
LGHISYSFGSQYFGRVSFFAQAGLNLLLF